MKCCLERGADCSHMPADATASQNPIISCLIQIQTGFTFLVPAYLGCPEKRPLNGCSSSVEVITVSHLTSEHWKYVHFEAKFIIFRVSKFPKVRHKGKVGNETNIWWHMHSVITVPKIMGIGQLLLKLSLKVRLYNFLQHSVKKWKKSQHYAAWKIKRIASRTMQEARLIPTCGQWPAP